MATLFTRNIEHAFTGCVTREIYEIENATGDLWLTLQTSNGYPTFFDMYGYSGGYDPSFRDNLNGNGTYGGDWGSHLWSNVLYNGFRGVGGRKSPTHGTCIVRVNVELMAAEHSAVDITLYNVRATNQNYPTFPTTPFGWGTRYAIGEFAAGSGNVSTHPNIAGPGLVSAGEDLIRFTWDAASGTARWIEV